MSQANHVRALDLAGVPKRLRRRLRVANVAPQGPGGFTFDEPRVEVLLMRVEAGLAAHCIDLVCWQSSRPDRWRTYADVASVLGTEALSIDGLNDGPVTVHATPLEWLAAGADRDNSVCILDWTPARVRLAFAPARRRKIICSGLKLAERLAAALKPPAEKWDIHVATTADGKVAA